MICEKIGASDCLTFVDIDKKLMDSQIWSAYAPDIYTKVRVSEVCQKLVIKQSYAAPLNCFCFLLCHNLTALLL